MSHGLLWRLLILTGFSFQMITFDRAFYPAGLIWLLAYLNTRVGARAIRFRLFLDIGEEALGRLSLLPPPITITSKIVYLSPQEGD